MMSKLFSDPQLMEGCSVSQVFVYDLARVEKLGSRLRLTFATPEVVGGEFMLLRGLAR